VIARDRNVIAVIGKLPVHRFVAREMIVAQQMAGGTPAQEIDRPRVSEKLRSSRVILSVKNEL